MTVGRAQVMKTLFVVFCHYSSWSIGRALNEFPLNSTLARVAA